MFNRIKISKPLFILASAFVLQNSNSHAVLFYSTADPSHNTAAPTGILAGSGWQYQGEWNGFSGTPIASHYFVTAQHIGGANGDVFQWNNLSFTTINHFDDPSSDLRIWQVRETFSTFAPLYTLSDEVGKPLVVIGRGTQRGEAVTVNGKVHGWQPGTFDRVQRWGQNVVASTTSDSPGGEQLTATFDATGGENEADLSEGDSGGAVYIQDGSIWKLAGINYAVDGNYNNTTTGPGFAADLFDYGGLYNGQEGDWTFYDDLPTPQPGSFYATRISGRTGWINSILSIPAAEIKLQIAPVPQGPYLDDGNASIDPSSQIITTSAPSLLAAFYRIAGPTAKRITSIKKVSNKLQISYQ